jgi:hypothetical protein
VLYALSAGAAGLEPVAQERSVRTSIVGSVECINLEEPFCSLFYPPPNGDFEETAVGLEHFTAEVATEASSADQDSLIHPTLIRAEGSIEAYHVDDFDGEAHTTASTTASSNLSVTFQLDAPTEYVLRAGFEGSWFNTAAELRVDLQGPSGPVAQLFPTNCEITMYLLTCYPEAQVVTGVLAPGQYTLEAHVAGDGSPFPLGGPPGTASEGRFEVVLSVPGPLPALTPIGAAICAVALFLLGAARLHWSHRHPTSPGMPARRFTRRRTRARRAGK